MEFLKFCAVVAEQLCSEVGPGRHGNGSIQWRFYSQLNHFGIKKRMSHLGTPGISVKNTKIFVHMSLLGFLRQLESSNSEEQLFLCNLRKYIDI